VFGGAEGFYGFGYPGDDIDELRGFGRGDPRKMKPSRFYAHMLDEVFEQCEFPACVVITFQVMAFSGMSPGGPDAVGALAEGGQYELGAQAPGTRNTDNPDIGRIFHASHTRQIRSPVTAPVTKEAYDFRFPIRHFNS